MDILLDCITLDAHMRYTCTPCCRALEIAVVKVTSWLMSICCGNIPVTLSKQTSRQPHLLSVFTQAPDQMSGGL